MGRAQYRVRSGDLIMGMRIGVGVPTPSLCFSPYHWFYYVFHDIGSCLLESSIGRPHGWYLRVRRWERLRAITYWEHHQQLWIPFLTFWNEYKIKCDLLVLPCISLAQGHLGMVLHYATHRVPGTLLKWNLAVDIDERLSQFECLASSLEGYEGVEKSG